MNYSITVRLLTNSLRSLAILPFISGAGMFTANAQETPPPPKQAMPAEVAECGEYREREGTADLGEAQYRKKVSDLCNQSVHEAPAIEPGKEPATNDYYLSGENTGLVYELSEECQQARLQDELFFVCPDGKYKPTIRNNQSGFMLYAEPEVPLKPGEEQ